MWLEYRSRVGRGLLIGVLLIGLAVRLWVAWQPISTLLQKNLPDDAFYYFVLAPNIAHSGIASLDGVNATNGFHPLWEILLLPLFGGQLLRGDLPIHLALTAASAIDVVSIWLIAQIAARLTKREVLGVIAALLYAANPAVVLQITNGLETALSMATLTLFWWLCLQWIQQAENNYRLAVWVGVVGGLMFLARSDSVFFLGLALLGILWFRGWRSSWAGVALAGATAVIVTAPWFLWSRITVGTWVQDSGLAVPYAISERVKLEYGAGVTPWIQEGLRQLSASALWLRGDPTGLPLFFGIGLWVAVCAGVAWRWRKSARRAEVTAVLPLLGAGALLILIHVGVRQYPRPWYFVPVAAAFAVCAALALDEMIRHRNLIFSLTLAVFVYFGLSGYVLWEAGLYPWQSEMLAASTWIAQNTPPGASVGSLNAGIYAYYSGRRIVDLDGVVNHNAFAAVQEHAIIPYLRASGVSYFVDYDWAIRHEYAPFMGTGYPQALEEIAILGGGKAPALGQLRAYRVTAQP